ncbi:endolytic transglycosylase MltG, partial [Patescibacteria group bacterium]|nr:endolytic transglycosylase MltG [Patescibacteria group bacterium]
DEQIIRNAWIFKKYLIYKGLDKKVNYGEFEVEAPITVARVAQTLSQPGLSEREITIIPGWGLNDIGEYLEKEGIGTKQDFFYIVGRPGKNYKITAERAPEINSDLKILQDKPWYVSYEGYFAPETYRIYKNSSIEEVVERLFEEREKQITDEMWQDIEKSGKSFFDILIMASVLEKEARDFEEMSIISDIFWRRHEINWALQSCATVNYITGKNDPGISLEDKEIESAFNTYKYPGLPLGPISNPSLDAIEASIYPQKNDYWYFLTGTDLQMYYAKTLEGHNENKGKYL